MSVRNWTSCSLNIPNLLPYYAFLLTSAFNAKNAEGFAHFFQQQLKMTIDWRKMMKRKDFEQRFIEIEDLHVCSFQQLLFVWC